MKVNRGMDVETGVSVATESYFHALGRYREAYTRHHELRTLLKEYDARFGDLK